MQNFEVRQSGASYYNLATVWYQFYFQWQMLPPTGTSAICNFQDGASAGKCFLHINSSGQLVFFDFNATLVATGATSWLGGVWYQVQAKIGTGASTAWEIKVNGNVEISGTSNIGTNNNGSIKFGGNAAYTRTFEFDDINVDNAAYPAAVTGSTYFPHWLGNHEFPAAAFRDRNRAYRTTSPNLAQEILTALDQAAPAQFGFLPNQEPPLRPRRPVPTGIPGYATAVFPPGPWFHVPDLPRTIRPVAAGQHVRYDDPYLSIPATGWLRHEEPPRRVRSWMYIISPDRSQYLSDPQPLGSAIFQGLTQEMARPRGKPPPRQEQAQSQYLDPSLQLPFPMPFLVQTMPPFGLCRAPKETAVTFSPFPQGSGQLNFVLQAIDVQPLPRRGQLAPGGSDHLPTVISFAVGIAPPGSWAMTIDTPYARRARPDPSHARQPMPSDLQTGDVQGWNMAAQQIVRPRVLPRAGGGNDALQFFSIVSADLQFGWQGQSVRSPAPVRATLLPFIPFVGTAAEGGDDSAAFRVWDVPAQTPQFRGLTSSRMAEAQSQSFYSFSLMISGPWYVPEAEVYFAGAFQADIRVT